MTEPMRPLSIGELLDRTFSLYRQNFKLFVGVSILGPAAMLCFQTALSAIGVGGSNGSGVIRNSPSVIAAIIVGVVVYLIGHSISAAATVRAVAAVYLGRVISIGEAFSSVKGRVMRVVGVVISAMLLVMLVGALLIGVGAAIFSLGITLPTGTAARIVGGLLGGAVLVALILVVIGFAVRYALAVQACVVESLGVGASLTRSRVLAKGDRKRIVTTYVVCMVVIYVVSLLFTGLSMLVPTGHSLLARQAATQVANLLAGALAAPLMTIAMSLVYYDERVRKEAFDLQFLMESLDGVSPMEAPVADLGQ